MKENDTLPEGTYFTKDLKIGFALIDMPNSIYKENCWLVGEWWVTDNGSAKDWSLMNTRRKWKAVRKIDYSNYAEKEKVQYARGAKTAKELGFFGA